ncbi:Fur family transcriptional regulator [Komagataeibacter oboediens]|uniref:Fur family transcriptional regulator n=1 Tax=Komagataeibacter oboediens TaxID=65958 RepID=UPI001C2D679F|nr:Fur family transcriptional regulator [Komagataeibacter oboediens]MBV1822770.1 Fur family transcriptional regulator [Komagataeibacter oboediens]
MLAFSEHRRSPPALSQIRPGMGASRSAVRKLEDRCREAGVKMTDLRRVLLHGILEAGAGATAIEIWKTLRTMTDGHPPSQGSIQRNLNLLVARDILRRDVSPDRLWHYGIAPERKGRLAVTFVEAGTGRKIPCRMPEVAALLRRAAAEHGLAVQAAAITVTPVPATGDADIR